MDAVVICTSITGNQRSVELYRGTGGSGCGGAGGSASGSGCGAGRALVPLHQDKYAWRPT